eukprot:1364760-Ditylum_brightwellii.AAC.2
MSRNLIHIYLFVPPMVLLYSVPPPSLTLQANFDGDSTSSYLVEFYYVQDTRQAIMDLENYYLWYQWCGETEDWELFMM